jgi:predicted glutamine amidotransferase
MCIAIANGKKTTLKKEWIKNSWENNGDGAGIMWLNNGKLEYFKELKSFDAYYKKYIDVRRLFPKSNLLLHFRISTHGKINETNCHPFVVSEEVGFIHNGMIHQVERNTEFSDTYMFNELILKKLPKGFQHCVATKELLESYIDSSKLVFLDTDNKFSIVNEQAGHWFNDCWFSNSSYKEVNDWYDFGGKKVKKQTTSAYHYGTDSYWSGGWSAYNGNTQTTQSTGDICEECGVNLIEGEHQFCQDCREEMISEWEHTLAAEEGYTIDDNAYLCQCDACDTYTYTKWNVSYNASLCKHCEHELEVEAEYSLSK